MNCPNCGAEVPEGSESCPSCGAKLQVLSQLPSELAQRQRKLKWLPIVIPGILGAGLMFLMGYLLAGVIASASENSTLGITLGIGAFCYLLTGLSAGVWAGSRGTTHGMWAAIILFAVNLIVSIAMLGIYYVLSGLWGLLLGLAFAIALGALGGALGARIRPSKA